MAKKKKLCPACQKEINESAKKCPKCNKKLEILNWEIEWDSGQKLQLSGPDAENSIRDQLISGQLKLENRCRQFVTSLQSVKDEKEYYEVKQEKDWKTLRDYANDIFSLQVLYDPQRAYGKKFALITTAIIGIITAIAWDSDLLLTVGANPIMAIICSVLLIALSPTVIGLFIASAIVGRIYHLSPFGLAVRTFVALFIGVVIGLVVGWTIGYLIGVVIGKTKKKVLED
jgi:hypothetical protein